MGIRVTSTKTSLSTSVNPDVAKRISDLTMEFKSTKSKLIYALILTGLENLKEAQRKLDVI